METITFSGVVKDYQSAWYIGFYRVKPDQKIQNPRSKTGTSNQLVYLINKAIDPLFKIETLSHMNCRLIGRAVRVTGHWFQKFSKFFFEVEKFELIET